MGDVPQPDDPRRVSSLRADSLAQSMLLSALHRWLMDDAATQSAATFQKGQSVVWMSSTSVLALRKTLPGTEPSHLSLRVFSPTLPTTNRSALTSLARRKSACTGSPLIGRASISFAPAALARSLASRRIA